MLCGNKATCSQTATDCQVGTTLTFTFDRKDGLVLAWPVGNGTLEQSPSVLGPWSEVSGATNPHVHDSTLGSVKFYRLIKRE